MSAGGARPGTISSKFSFNILLFANFGEKFQSLLLPREFRKHTVRIEEKHERSNMSCGNWTKKRGIFYATFNNYSILLT